MSLRDLTISTPSARLLNADPDEVVTFVGELRRVSDQLWNGWGYAWIRSPTFGEVKVTGTMEGLYPGALVRVEGKWHENPKYGTEIRATLIVEEAPNTTDGVTAWLANHLPNVGSVRATELVKQFGLPGLWDVIDNEPKKLTVISGITEERAYEIRAAYIASSARRELYLQLHAWGLSDNEIRRVWALGDEFARSINGNPYILYFEVRGFSFRRVELIATKARFDRNSPERIQAAVVEALRDHSQLGHTLTPRDLAVTSAFELLRRRIPAPEIEAVIDSMVTNSKKYIVSPLDGLLMLTSLHQAESRILSKIQELLSNAETTS